MTIKLFDRNGNELESAEYPTARLHGTPMPALGSYWTCLLIDGHAIAQIAPIDGRIEVSL